MVITNTVALADSETRPWHPKLTAYRSLVLTTTAGLGTFKAIAVSRGLSVVSNTTEWIGGVVLFSAIFVVGLFEPRPPQSLKWLLDYDLMRLLWKACRFLFSLTPPNYRTDEMVIDPSSNQGHPPITGYRLLCSVLVSLFGIVKAYFAYSGVSPTALNVIDWSSGTVLVFFLYLLGMYEQNPVGLMPSLFSNDYSPIVSTCGSFTLFAVLYVVGFSLTIYITLLFFNLSSQMDKPVDFRMLYDGTPSQGPPTFFSSLHDKISHILLNATMYMLILTMLIACLFFIGLLAYYLGNVPVVRRLARPITQRVYRFLSDHFNQLSFYLSGYVSRPQARVTRIYRFIRRFGFHILCYTIACMITAIVAFACLGFPFRIWYIEETTTGRAVFIFSGVVYTTILGGIGVFLSLLFLFLMKLLAEPFLVDWSSPTYQWTPLEFSNTGLVGTRPATPLDFPHRSTSN